MISKIGRKYNLLKTLQVNNLYDDSNKEADRNVSKDILTYKHPDKVKKY